MALTTIAYIILSYVATIILIVKADEYYGIYSIILAPVTFHRIVFGSGFYILIPFILSALYVFLSDLFVIGILIWHVIFAISLAKAYSSSTIITVVSAISLLIFPGISWIILGFVGGPYQGPVNLIWFAKR